ncbi:hypothetical protein JW968_07270 [Candidatus Woesearchaeota archaeon]|nr:hypothetical protein [Candidatus Woesearchaeota archaeon]
MRKKHKFGHTSGFSTKQLIIALIAIIILTVSLTSIAYFSYMHVETRTIEMDIKVVEKGVGINLGDDFLHFGSAQKGGSTLIREVVLINPYNFPLDVKMKVVGNISGMVEAIPSMPHLEPNEAKTIQLIGIPNKEIGYYHGYAKMTFWRSK